MNQKNNLMYNYVVDEWHGWDIDEKEQEKLSQVKSLFISKSTSIVNILIGEIDCSAHFILEKIDVDPNNSKLYSNDSNSIITKNEQTLLLGCKNTIIPNGVKTIFWAAFLGCDIEKINIPSSVEKIGNNAFFRCQNLKNIELKEGIKEIGEYAFCRNINLKQITIPNTVKTIRAATFKDCTHLKSIRLSPRVKRINSYAFEGCISLDEFIYSHGISSINKKAFFGCNLLHEKYFKNVLNYFEW